MLRRFSREHFAVALLVIVRTAFCGYRAAHQSITIDEAYAYNDFLSGPWSMIYESYTAANHVLYSILAKLCITVFGLSEFTLRLPTVASGAFLVLGIYAILAETVSSAWVRWIALIGISLHPLLLDFSVAARGYGLAVALLIWAVYFLIRGRGILSGLLLGLSVSANLVAAFPALGLMACPLLLGVEDLDTRLRRIARVAIPAAVVAAALCYPAMSEATTGNFYLGQPTAALSLFSIVSTSLRGTIDRFGIFGSDRGAQFVQYFLLPVLTVLLLVGAVRAIRVNQPRPPLIPFVTLLVALAAIVAAHLFFGVPYPADRQALCLIPLMGLAWGIASLQFPFGVRAVNAAFAGALIAQMGTQLHTDYFSMWVFDLPMKQIATRLRDETAGAPSQSVSVSTQWLHREALEFYRRRYRLAALKPVERHESTLYEGFDYYVFDPVRETGPALTRHDYIELLKDPRSGVLLVKEPLAP